MKHSYKLYTIALLSALLSFTPAYADHDDHFDHDNRETHGHAKHSHHGKHEWHEHDEHGSIVFLPADRTVIHEYIVHDYHRHCPPGLAKKHNGCLPPGQAKKHYIIGQPIPDVAILQPVPQELLVQLHPVPPGYQYVMADKDVLLVSEASHKIIDAVMLLSAVGH